MTFIWWLIALAVIFFIVRGIFRAISGPRMMPPGYGGGQMGGNYQIGNFVIGGEWDADWTSSHTGNGVVIPSVGTIAVTDNNRWITTVAARFGYAVDQWLFYGSATFTTLAQQFGHWTIRSAVKAPTAQQHYEANMRDMLGILDL